MRIKMQVGDLITIARRKPSEPAQYPSDDCGIYLGMASLNIRSKWHSVLVDGEIKLFHSASITADRIHVLSSFKRYNS